MKHIISLAVAVAIGFLLFLGIKPSEHASHEKDPEVSEFQSQVEDWVQKEDRKIQGQLSSQNVELVSHKNINDTEQAMSTTELALIPSR